MKYEGSIWKMFKNVMWYMQYLIQIDLQVMIYKLNKLTMKDHIEVTESSL